MLAQLRITDSHGYNFLQGGNDQGVSDAASKVAQSESKVVQPASDGFCKICIGCCATCNCLTDCIIGMGRAFPF